MSLDEQHHHKDKKAQMPFDPFKLLKIILYHLFPTISIMHSGIKCGVTEFVATSDEFLFQYFEAE